MENIKLGGIKFPKKLIPKGGNDRVYTPPDLAKSIVKHFQPSGDCLEPCSGKRAFEKAMLELNSVRMVARCEIDDGIDFLSAVLFHYDWIITNPPFSKFRAFLKKSMEVADNVVFLCTINHIFGLRARLRDIKEAGFYIREALLCDTPQSWPSSGFQTGAIYLNKQAGDCKISYL